MDRIYEDGTEMQVGDKVYRNQTTVSDLLVMMAIASADMTFEQLGLLYDMTAKDAKEYVKMGFEIVNGTRLNQPKWLEVK